MPRSRRTNAHEHRRTLHSPADRGIGIDEVVDDVKQLLGSLQTQLPASVKLSTLYDRSVSIRQSVDDVQFTLVLAICLVVLVIFCSCGTFRRRSFRASRCPCRSWPRSGPCICWDSRPKLAQIPGIRAFVQNLPPIRIGGQLTKSLYQLCLQGPDTDDLYQQVPALEAKLRQLPGLVDVTSDLQIKNPQVNIQIDRDRASALGVTPQQIEDALYDAYGARQISTIDTPNNQYKVIVELLPKYQEDPSVLPLLYIRSSQGKLVPLDTVAQMSRSVGPLTVNHVGQLPAVTLSFNLRPAAKKRIRSKPETILCIPLRHTCASKPHNLLLKS
jgi:multidrug efflux pump subunit AcrB